MATRLDLRTQVRRRLEDTAVSPLWDDATLNDTLAEAMHAYGVAIPLQVATAFGVFPGATSFALPAGVSDGQGVVRILDAAGNVLPRQQDPHSGFGPSSVTFVEQAWRIWAGKVQLQRPPAAVEIWSIEHRAGRQLVADDVTAQPIAAGDEELIVWMAAELALRRRAVEDAKRGSGDDARQVQRAADEARQHWQGLLTRRRRRARHGWLL